MYILLEMAKLRAVPLCLPNNCIWDEKTGEYSKNAEERKTLYVVDAALQKLQSIKGPVCTVSIAGPCRKGKSYLLSKAFDQGEVFPLGHQLDPETMGIWMWIVPKKFKDATGQEFTVVLLDSEGIGAVSSEGSDDHCIFTLTILLSSVLIYNSAGVPTRSDLDELYHMAKLSQHIQVRSSTQPQDTDAAKEEDTALFFKSFPILIWLLRDVVLALPEQCFNVKEYFLSTVFKSTSEAEGQESNEIAKSILSFFPEFHAFKLRPPSSNPEVMSNLTEKEFSEVNKKFVWGIDSFKRILHCKLAPKRSFNDAEFVTGEGLAELVVSYVGELNNPGTVVNVAKIWDSFVARKCTDVKIAAMAAYDKAMASEIEGKLPFESEVLHQAQQAAMDSALKLFQEETFGISTANVEKYLKEMMIDMEYNLNRWQQENSYLAKESCRRLLVELKKLHIDPVLTRLRGQRAVEVSFSEIERSYAAIYRDYKSEAKGPGDVCAGMFSEFQGEMQSEMQQHMDHLKQLKDFDENIAQEKKARALEEQEKMKAKEANARMEKERATRERQLTLLKERQEVEKRRLESQFRADLAAQKERMQSMMKANMEKLQKENHVAANRNKTLKNTIDSLQGSLNEKENQIQALKRRI